MLSNWLSVLALVLLLEGVGPALFPNRWRRYLAMLANEPVARLQRIGYMMLATAALLALFAKLSG